MSIDDFYLTHDAQEKLATSHPGNPLVQHRGQPGTHDLPLAKSVFRSLFAQEPNIPIPSYDKSAFNGQGDRSLKSEWRHVNSREGNKVEAVVFEGWCVGFRPLEDDHLKVLWEQKVQREQKGEGRSNGRLGLQRLEDVMFVNEKLKEYDELTE